MKPNTCPASPRGNQRRWTSPIFFFVVVWSMADASAHAQGDSARYITSGGAVDFVAGQGRVLDGSQGTERIEIGTGSVSISGLFQGGVVTDVEKVLVEYKGTIENEQVDVKYTLATKMETMSNVVSGLFYRGKSKKTNKNFLILGVPVSGKRNISVSGSVSFASGRPTVHLTELAVPNSDDIFSGWLLGKGTNALALPYAECPFLTNSWIYPNPGHTARLAERYVIFKMFDDYNLELVRERTGGTRKHIDFTADDLASLQERAQRSDAIAQTMLSDLYYTGKKGVTPDPVEAYKWASIAATKTNRQAQALLKEYELFFTSEQISKGKGAANAFLTATNIIGR